MNSQHPYFMQNMYIYYNGKPLQCVEVASDGVTAVFEDAHGSTVALTTADARPDWNIVYDGDLPKDPEACCHLGMCCRDGVATGKKPGEALRYFRMAAEDGYPAGMRELGRCYEEGIGIEPDLEEAIKWYHRAVEAGDDDAVCCLALICDPEYSRYPDRIDEDEAFLQYQMVEASCAEAAYMLGHHVKNGTLGMDMCRDIEFYDYGTDDDARALPYFKAAAERGHALACAFVAQAYAYGEGAPIDRKEAYQWYLKGAKGRNIPCMINMADILHRGIGCAVDLDAAEYWARTVMAVVTPDDVNASMKDAAESMLAEILEEKAKAAAPPEKKRRGLFGRRKKS